jgi:hypothetical protein
MNNYDAQNVFVPPAHLPAIRRPLPSQFPPVPVIRVIHEHHGAPIDPDHYANLVITVGSAVFAVVVTGFICVGPAAVLFVLAMRLAMAVAK